MTKKILWIGDGVAKTGFSCVNHNIIKNLIGDNEYEVHHLAVNYRGDPHDNAWKIYPAAVGGDLWGFNRIREFAEINFDGIFILNDIWVIARYLALIKDNFKKVPPIIVYYPVDSESLDKDWFRPFDLVSRAVVYTNFAYKQSKEVYAGDIDVIPHGVDNNIFFKIDKPKSEIKASLYPNREDFLDSFIVLNANRNQPRKRIDLTVEGFSLFAKDKPENVKIYLHMGLKDVGWDIIKLTEKFGVHSRLIVTGRNPIIQQVPEEKLNIIYNATDVGINTSIGEGWALVNHEHASTGAPQVVADHSSLRELYKDCGLLIPTSSHQTNAETLTKSYVVKPEDVAVRLEEIYVDRELYKDLSDKTIKKFSDENFTWKYIVDNYWKKIFKETIT